MKIRLSIYTIFLSILFALSGCSFLKVSQERKIINAAVSIKGNINNSSSSDSPIVIGLFSSSQYTLVQSTVVYGNTSFKLLIPEGNYYLVAFEDTNQDFNLQKNESVGWFGKPSLLKAESDKPIHNIVLQLKRPAQVLNILPSIYKSAKEQTLILENDKSLGKKVSLSDPLFFPEVGKIGLWQPLMFLKENRQGIFFLQDYDPKKIPVLFFHGIGGTGGDLKTLISNIDTNKFQPWIVQYPSGLRLDLVASSASSNINKLRSKYNFNKYVVIAHSMGGLVSRSIIHKQLQQKRKVDIPLFVSISTPWGGHKAAVIGVKAAPVSIPVWFDIVPSSPFLKNLHRQISNADLNHSLFFSYKNGLSLINTENNDGSVTLSSQLFPVVQTKSKEIYGFDEGHVSVLENQQLVNKVNTLLSKIRPIK